MSDTDALISRRQFCVGACSAASCATLATLLSACSGSSTSPSGGSATPLSKASGQFANNSVQVTIAGSALASVGNAVLVESIAGTFLVARTSDSAFSAIDAVCTHEGCTVNGADGSEYVCPCHGSRYDRSGHVIHGPATASLRQYSSAFSGGVLTISL